MIEWSHFDGKHWWWHGIPNSRPTQLRTCDILWLVGRRTSYIKFNMNNMNVKNGELLIGCVDHYPEAIIQKEALRKSRWKKPQSSPDKWKSGRGSPDSSNRWDLQWPTESFTCGVINFGELAEGHVCWSLFDTYRLLICFVLLGLCEFLKINDADAAILWKQTTSCLLNLTERTYKPVVSMANM